jgi:hypothetical protein
MVEVVDVAQCVDVSSLLLCFVLVPLKVVPTPHAVDLNRHLAIDVEFLDFGDDLETKARASPSLPLCKIKNK